MAARWGCSIGEAVARTPSSELPLWVEIFRQEDEAREKIEWYFAQLTYEVHQIPFRVWGKQSPIKEFDRFLLTFSREDDSDKKKADNADPTDIAPDLDASKAAWAAVIGATVQNGKIVVGERGLVDGASIWSDGQVVSPNRPSVPQPPPPAPIWTSDMTPPPPAGGGGVMIWDGKGG